MTDKKILFLSDDNFESPVPRVMIDPWNGSSWKIIQKKVHTMRQLRSVNVKELEVVGCIVTFLTALCGDVDRSDRDVNDESEGKAKIVLVSHEAMIITQITVIY